MNACVFCRLNVDFLRNRGVPHRYVVPDRSLKKRDILVHDRNRGRESLSPDGIIILSEGVIP